MKILITLLLVLFASPIIAQDAAFVKVYDSKKDAEKAIKEGKYVSSIGWEIKEGGELKLGKGTMPDKTFAFITEMPNLLTYNQYEDYEKNKLSHSYNNKVAKLSNLYVAGSKKMGFYIVAKIKVGQLNRYLIDIENAIEANEIDIPAQFKKIDKQTETAITIKQEVSVADELSKLKKLYDDGVLTKEEYDEQKKKLLNK